jgi:murein DD-endopeptidase MepM/ murein hydrolase activator NlpD
LSAYAHNKEILVKEGQQVNRGQRIAEMGNTDTDQVKLHFEIRRQGKPSIRFVTFRRMSVTQGRPADGEDGELDLPGIRVR